MKKAVTIQDISCFGKCSITVALPIISAMGVECAVIPTAVLSTHTGGFKGFTFRDLTDDIPLISEHWEKENLCFDGLYTGYLGSPRQAEMINDFINTFKPQLIFVDPAMADNGKLYTGFDHSIVKAMRKLCSKADVIVPNLTEATLMLDEPFVPAGEYDEDYIHSLLMRLATEIGARTSIITGVIYNSKEQGAVAYDSVSSQFHEYFSENVPKSYHGTGDLFSSLLFGAMMRGKTIDESLKTAVDFTVLSIKHTQLDENYWYSVKFEECIPELVKMI